MADVIELMVNTRLGALHLLDWMDQALLYVHVGEQIDEYRDKKGIRTASAFVLSFFGPDNRWTGSWADPRPETPIFRVGTSGTAEANVIAWAIAIGQHPNFQRIERLRRLAKEQIHGGG